MSINKYRIIIFFSTYVHWIYMFILLGSCGIEKPAEIAILEDQLPGKIDFNLHVKPILSDKCFFCHGPDKNVQEAGLELATREGALAPLKEAKDKRAIVPGNLAKSEVFHRIISKDHEKMMPPLESDRVLSDYEKAIIIKWIEQGAEYKPHWALIKPEKHKLPEVELKEWPKNPIDYFVLNKLEEKRLKPSPEAEKETLLRRVSLDLTGLSPSIEDIDAFLSDNSENAYEKLVNKLLASPHYGEKMAVDWLDAARFADTHGYTVDRYRPMWPWRDWVIKAFNENMPFDQFTTWQLAGDLLPDATREQKIATGFNRNHAQNMEGGIVNEEFRVEYVADRTNTLGTAFLGLTLECARCHDHKYDPISQKDYYSIFSFFNNVDEAGQISFNDAPPGPTLLLTEAKTDSILVFLEEKIKKVESTLENLAIHEKPDFEKWKEKNRNNLIPDTKKGLQAHFTFDKLENGLFLNEASAKDKGTVADPELVPGKNGQAFKSNGDDILKLGKVGSFNRANPFSIGVWVKIPDDLSEGVIFHTGDGDITYGFRGYHLKIRNDKVAVSLTHTWPYNNIVKLSKQKLPKEKWTHLVMTYDGSSKAKGIKLYINGLPAELETEKDNLYKDLIFPGNQPGLQVGADWRAVGFKNGLVDDLVVFEREISAPEVLLLARKGEGTDMPTLNSFNPDDLLKFYLVNFSGAYQQQLKELEKLRLEKNKLAESIPEMMVMEEMKEKRPAFVLKRGHYDDYGEEVQPDVPGSILAFSDEFPRNRLGLAQWLMHPDNPLTSRVMVNRFWQNYFGTAIHKNTNDFGNQGGLPSHPELLDWLAVTFRESNWDIKALQKLLVMSATYRQSSFASVEDLQKDPENILLARGPAFRLTAEMVRDNALRVGGLLVPKIGGPSVKPYQPDGLWAVNNDVYVQDTGENLYRRSLYTFWRRTNPPPSMNTFDAPSRSYCLVQRQKTNTPLQALVLLNDPQFIEASRALSEKAFNYSNEVVDQVSYSYKFLTSRNPSERELSVLIKLYQSEYEKFKENPGKTKGWLHAGEYELKGIKDEAAIAAGTVVASTIMNSDAYITRR
ncbi:DUF1553 domain-containing protein [soil metagenome]